MKNVTIAILATATVGLGIALAVSQVQSTRTITKLEANCTSFETVNLQTIHPYNQCIKLTVQYAERQENNKMNLSKIAKYCSPLLIDKKEYREYKQYNNSSDKKSKK